MKYQPMRYHYKNEETGEDTTIERTEQEHRGDTFPLRILRRDTRMISVTEPVGKITKEMLFCTEINETKSVLCSYDRRVDYRRAMRRNGGREDDLLAINKCTIVDEERCQNFVMNEPSHPTYTMRCNYFSVHGQFAGCIYFGVCTSITRVVSTGGMWWSAIIQVYPQYQRISTPHIFVWIYYVFYVGHVWISCSTAKDCVVNDLDSWIIMLSLRYIHMMW